MSFPFFAFPHIFFTQGLTFSPHFGQCLTIFSQVLPTLSPYVCGIPKPDGFPYFKLLPSKPDVAPHLQSSSSSSPSSSPVSTHLEWGNTTNLYVLYSQGDHKSFTPYDKYVEWCNHINLSSKGINKSTTPSDNYVEQGITSTYRHKGSTNPPPL